MYNVTKLGTWHTNSKGSTRYVVDKFKNTVQVTYIKWSMLEPANV